MSANTNFRVKVLIHREEIVEISAVSSREAMAITESNPDVVRVLSVEWIDPEE